MSSASRPPGGMRRRLGPVPGGNHHLDHGSMHRLFGVTMPNAASQAGPRSRSTRRSVQGECLREGCGEAAPACAHRSSQGGGARAQAPSRRKGRQRFDEHQPKVYGGARGGSSSRIPSLGAAKCRSEDWTLEGHFKGRGASLGASCSVLLRWLVARRGEGRMPSRESRPGSMNSTHASRAERLEAVKEAEPECGRSPT
jgi:hypothetical protein